MQKQWLIAVLALIVGGLGGLMVGMHVEDREETSAEEHGAHAHHHDNLVEVPQGSVPPTVDAVVHTDPKGGYNVQIITTNFRFAPQNASTEHVFGEGHAHLYVDDVKINRVYGEWYHLASLGGVGEHEVRVELSTNDHGTYAVNGEVIADTEVVVVNESEEEHHEDEAHSDEGHMEHDDAMSMEG